MLLGSRGLAYHAKTEITCRKSFIELTSGHSNTKIPISVIRKKKKEIFWMQDSVGSNFFVPEFISSIKSGKIQTILENYLLGSLIKRDRVKDKNDLLLV